MMGFNTVAVLLNDFIHELERDGRYGARIAEAMRNVGHRREGLSTSFGAGSCISQAHADHTQIVVVGRNTGKPPILYFAYPSVRSLWQRWRA